MPRRHDLVGGRRGGYRRGMKYGTSFTDEQIVAALRAAAAEGVAREDACDRVQPPNLCAFLNNLPAPERERLVALAYPAPKAGERPPGR
jgi:hypothetical protein